jgi:Concanavalin A-like lectin/glucanases superfamily/Immunoglobulin domain
MKTLTLPKLLPPLVAGILLTLGSTSRAQPIFSENFNSYTNGNQNAAQSNSGLPVSFGGTVPGWSNTGAGSVHAVNLNGVDDYAVMIFQDNVITLTNGIAANDKGTGYEVDFLAGPAVYADPGQGTTAADGLVIDVLRADNSVLFSDKTHPGVWAGSETLTPFSFAYVGDGSGPVRLRVSPLLFNDGHFVGAIDNLSVTNLGAAPPPTIITQPVGGSVVGGDNFTLSVVGNSWAMTYQWLKNGTPISGATNSSYSIYDVTTNDNGNYTVVVGNPVGTKTSTAAVLNVTPAPTYPNFQAAVLANKPIHYYPLADTNGTTAVDLGSEAIPGTYNGGFTLGQPLGDPNVAGFTRCAVFDGKPGTYVDCGAWDPGTAVTVAAWVNMDPTAGSANNWHDIAGRVGSYVLDFSPSNDNVQFVAWNPTGGQAAAITPFSATRGQWHFFVGEYDDVANTATVFVDGVQGPIIPGTGLATLGPDGPPTQFDVLLAGSRSGSSASFNFKGSIAQVAFYANALSPAQIRAQFRSAVPPVPPLDIARTTILSWPSLPPGFVLQSATSPAGPYTNYTGIIYTAGNYYVAPLPAGTTNVFRLSGRSP